jgi:hypothetical protein
MARENLVLDVNINPFDQPRGTEPQISTPTQFTSGFSSERQTAIRNVALVGFIGLAGKRIFDSATGGVGQRTGRSDLQRKIDRGSKVFGIGSQIVLGFVTGQGIGGAVAIGKVAIDLGVEAFERNIERDLDNKEATYRRQLRGNRTNESRSRV